MSVVRIEDAFMCSHKSKERKIIGFEMMYHAKNIRKKQLIGRKMLWIFKYLGMLALRPTASYSPENSHFSQKLLSSCTEAALEHCMFLLF